MLIIFDLDDTLIDTSGSLIPACFKEVLSQLENSGMAFSSLEDGLATLHRLDASRLTSTHSLEEFLEIHDALPSHYALAHKELQAPLTVTPQLLPGASSLLYELVKKHDLVLVTIGDGDRQWMKIMSSGLPTHLFKKIIICSEKKSVYEKLMEEFPYPPGEVVVIGDRISRDLKPGKELGFKTIHIKWGRGLNCIDIRGEADHTIWQLEDCKKILNLIQNFQEQHDNKQSTRTRNDHFG